MGSAILSAGGGGLFIRNGSLAEYYGQSDIPAGCFVDVNPAGTTRRSVAAPSVCKLTDETYLHMEGATLYVRDKAGNEISSLATGLTFTDSDVGSNIVFSHVFTFGGNRVFASLLGYDSADDRAYVSYAILTHSNGTLTLNKTGSTYASISSSAPVFLGGCSIGSSTYVLLSIGSSASAQVNWLVNISTGAATTAPFTIKGAPFCIDEANRIIGTSNGIYEVTDSSITTLLTTSNTYYDSGASGFVVSPERFLTLSRTSSLSNFLFNDFYKENGTWKYVQTTVTPSSGTYDKYASPWISYWSDNEIYIRCGTLRKARISAHTLEIIEVANSTLSGWNGVGTTVVFAPYLFVGAAGGGAVSANDSGDSTITYLMEPTVSLRAGSGAGGRVTKTACKPLKKGKVYE